MLFIRLHAPVKHLRIVLQHFVYALRPAYWRIQRLSLYTFSVIMARRVLFLMALPMAFVCFCFYFFYQLVSLIHEHLQPHRAKHEGANAKQETGVPDRKLELSNFGQPTTPDASVSTDGHIPHQSPHIVSLASAPYTKPNPLEVSPPSDRPLILYVYHETDFALLNLKFFIKHALHSAGDFVFILNGPSPDAESLIFSDPYGDVPTDIRHLFPHHSLSNIFVKRRPNTCFDLGAHAEVLNSVVGEGPNWRGVKGEILRPIHLNEGGHSQKLRHRYKGVILMNASIRGPFLPSWSNSCWSDVYLNRLTEKVKLVGTAYNCHSGVGHVQSMLWATDSVGLDLMLTKEGIGEDCFESIGRAMDGEVRVTKLLRDKGYEVDAFLSIYHQQDKQTKWDRLRAKMNAGLYPKNERDNGKYKREGDDLTQMATPEDDTEEPATEEPLRQPNQDELRRQEEEAVQRTLNGMGEESKFDELTYKPEHYPLFPRSDQERHDEDGWLQDMRAMIGAGYGKLKRAVASKGMAFHDSIPGIHQQHEHKRTVEEDAEMKAIVDLLASFRDLHDVATDLAAISEKIGGAEDSEDDRERATAILSKIRVIQVNALKFFVDAQISRPEDMPGPAMSADYLVLRAEGLEARCRVVVDEVKALLDSRPAAQGPQCASACAPEADYAVVAPVAAEAPKTGKSFTPYLRARSSPSTGSEHPPKAEPLLPTPTTIEHRPEVAPFLPPLIHPEDDISAQMRNYTQDLIDSSLNEPGYYWRECKEEDWLGPHSYAEAFVHPYENLFIKSHRHIADAYLGNLTEWVDGAGYSSWEVCR